MNALSVASQGAVYDDQEITIPNVTGVSAADFELSMETHGETAAENSSAEIILEDAEIALEGFTAEEISELQNAYVMYAKGDEGLTPHDDLMKELFGG